MGWGPSAIGCPACGTLLASNSPPEPAKGPTPLRTAALFGAECRDHIGRGNAGVLEDSLKPYDPARRQTSGRRVDYLKLNFPLGRVEQRDPDRRNIDRLSGGVRDLAGYDKGSVAAQRRDLHVETGSGGYGLQSDRLIKLCGFRPGADDRIPPQDRNEDDGRDDQRGADLQQPAQSRVHRLDRRRGGTAQLQGGGERGGAVRLQDSAYHGRTRP